MPDGPFGVLSKALGLHMKSLTGLGGAALGWSEPAIRRHVMRHFVPGFLRAGKSGNQILGLFKEAGYGIRRKEFLRVARESREINRSQDAAAAVGAGERIDVSAARQVDKWGESEFAARLRVEWTDVETGEYRHSWLTIDVDEGEERESVFQRATDVMALWYHETVGERGEAILSMRLGDIIRHRV